MNKRWWWVIGTLGVVVAACIGALVRIGSDQGVKPDWYSAWASAASAFIAAAALVAAALAAKATIETNRTQTLQLARLEEAQLSERASKFAVWRAKFATPDEITYRTFFHNAGPLPIYNVIIHYFVNGHEYTSKANTLPPTQSPDVLDVPDRNLRHFIRRLSDQENELPKLQPQPEINAIPDVNERAQAMANRLLMVRGATEAEATYRRNARIEVGVSFSDGEHTWYRSPTGRLERTS